MQDNGYLLLLLLEPPWLTTCFRRTDTSQASKIQGACPPEAVRLGGSLDVLGVKDDG